MSVFYANKITLQLSDSVRLIFHDERGKVTAEEPMPVTRLEEVVLSHQNARALRDMLVEHLKEETTLTSYPAWPKQ